MILAVVQARLSSSRLPGKVLADVLGEPMIGRQLDRVGRCRRIDELVVATSTDPSDDPLADWCDAAGVARHRGPLEDVLSRFVGAMQPYDPAHVVRLTADCPLADAAVLDELVALHVDGGFDYSSNCWEPTFPHGFDAEVVRADWLRRLDELACSPYEREHVTVWFRAHEHEIRRGELRLDPPHPEWRVTVDHPEDLAVVRAVFGALQPCDPAFTLADVVELLERRPDLRAANASVSSVRLHGAQAALRDRFGSPAAGDAKDDRAPAPAFELRR